MSVRNDILNSLVTALRGITKANGYNRSIRTVSRVFEPWQSVPQSKMPILFVLDDGTEDVDNDSGGGQWIFSLYRPAIVGYITGQPEDLPDQFGDVDADLKKFLYSQPDLGTNCKQILFEGYDLIITIDKFIVFQIRPYIIYDFDITNP